MWPDRSVGRSTAASFFRATAGTVTLSGLSTFVTSLTAASVTINGGTLSISNDLNLGAAPTAPTQGVIVLGAGTLATTYTFTLNANRGIALTNAAASTISVASGTTLT